MQARPGAQDLAPPSPAFLPASGNVAGGPLCRGQLDRVKQDGKQGFGLLGFGQGASLSKASVVQQVFQGLWVWEPEAATGPLGG